MEDVSKITSEFAEAVAVVTVKRGETLNAMTAAWALFNSFAASSRRPSSSARSAFSTLRVETATSAFACVSWSLFLSTSEKSFV